MKISSTNQVGIDSIKIVVAGEAGNGKTTLAATLSEPTLIISAEAGLLSLKNADIDTVDMQQDDAGNILPKEKRVQRLGEIYNWLLLPEQIKKYKWIFIDSLTEINQNVLEYLESKEEFQGPKNTIKKYGELSVQMRRVAKLFRDMPNYNIVFTALTKVETNNDGVQKLKIDVMGKFSDQLPALFDCIFYLGVSSEVGEDGRNKRVLQTQKTDKIDFPKDRSGKLERFEEPNISLIVQKIRKSPTKTETNTTTLGENT